MHRTRAALAVLVLAACSSSEQVAELGLGDACLLGSDCPADLVCVFSRCHQQCGETRDCPAGQRCVIGDKPKYVCQLADERACEYNSDCSASQLCAVDGQCRDQCVTPEDCVPGQVCISGTCADPSELEGGDLPGRVVDGGAPCVWDSDCPTGMHCNKQQCLFDCIRDADCPAGSSCVDHRCVTSDPRGDCVPGQQPHCTCDDGSDGVRVCQPDLTYGPCTCSPVGVGGATSSSTASGGGLGGASSSSSSSSSSTGTAGAGGAGTTTSTGVGGVGTGGSGSTTSTATVGPGVGGGGSGSTTNTATVGPGVGGGGSGPATNTATATVGPGGAGGSPAGTGGFGTAAATTVIDSVDSPDGPQPRWLGAPQGDLLVSFGLPGVVNARVTVDDLGQAVFAGGLTAAMELAGATVPTDGDDLVFGWLDGIDVQRAVRYQSRHAREASATAANGSGDTAVAGLDGDGGFVAVVASDGSLRWEERLGASALTAIAMDRAGGVVVAGEASDGVHFGSAAMPFVARFEPDGHLAWQRTLGDGVSIHAIAIDEQARGGCALATCASGGVVLAGALEGTLQLPRVSLESAGGRDLLLLRLDPDGNPEAGARFGDHLSQEIRAISIDQRGGLLVAGQFHGVLDLGKRPLESAGGSDAFVAAFDAHGRNRWGRSFGGHGADGLVALAEDGAGEVVVAGYFGASFSVEESILFAAGGSDVFVGKLDADGGPLWMRAFGKRGAEHPTSLAIAPSDAIVLGIASPGGMLDVGAGPQRGDSFVVVLAP